MLRDLAVFAQHRDLRHSFVQVDTHVKHPFGLLFSERFGHFSEIPAYF
jgi:hypothetical protein